MYWWSTIGPYTYPQAIRMIENNQLPLEVIIHTCQNIQFSPILITWTLTRRSILTYDEVGNHFIDKATQYGYSCS